MEASWHGLDRLAFIENNNLMRKNHFAAFPWTVHSQSVSQEEQPHYSALNYYIFMNDTINVTRMDGGSPLMMEEE